MSIASAIAAGIAAVPAEFKSVATIRREVQGPRNADGSSVPSMATIENGDSVSLITYGVAASAAARQWGAEARVTLNAVLTRNSSNEPDVRPLDGVVVLSGILANQEFEVAGTEPTDAAGVVLLGLRASKRNFR